LLQKLEDFYLWVFIYYYYRGFQIHLQLLLTGLLSCSHLEKTPSFSSSSTTYPTPITSFYLCCGSSSSSQPRRIIFPSLTDFKLKHQAQASQISIQQPSFEAQT
jgi:hypothetical protein